MLSVVDVANRLIELALERQDEELTPLKLQKLLYYAQGYHLAAYDTPLFPETIESWEHGPVIPDIWRIYQGQKEAITTFNVEMSTAAEPQSDFLEQIYDLYGQYSAWELRDRTHLERPWQETPRNNVISHEILASFFEDFVYEEDGKPAFMTYDLRSLSVNGVKYSVMLVPDMDTGGYVALCPDLKGCATQGESLPETLHNSRLAIRDWLDAKEAA